MRKLLIVPALLLICSIATAGENSMENVTSNPIIRNIFPHFNSGAGISNGGAANGGAANHLRLVGKVYFSYQTNTFQPVDSVTYSYSEGRGGIPNSEDMNSDDHVFFDVSVKYSYKSSLGHYEQEKQREQKFKDKNINTLVYRNWNSTKNIWENHKKYNYYYDASGKMLVSNEDQWYGIFWANGVSSSLDYDNSNNVIKMNSNTYNMEFSYDANNNLLVVEDYEKDAGVWVKKERKNYSYSSNNDVTEYILQKWIGNSWLNVERTGYQHDANRNVSIKTLYKWANGNWQYDKRHMYTYDSKDNMLEDVAFAWQGSVFTELKKEVRKYNSQSLAESLTTYSWNGTTWAYNTGDIHIKYYYQYYNPSSISTHNDVGKVAVYPIPARDNITLDMNMNSSEHFSIIISDMSGKVMYSKADVTGMKTREIIPVHNFSPGNYLISINSGKEHHIQKFVVYH